MKFKVMIDDTIQGAIHRIVESVLGQVSVQITFKKSEYIIKITDSDITPEQKTTIQNMITVFLESLGKYSTFEDLQD